MKPKDRRADVNAPVPTEEESEPQSTAGALRAQWTPVPDILRQGLEAALEAFAEEPEKDTDVCGNS